MAQSPADRYLALHALAGRYGVLDQDSADLTAHELRVFSQNGEDGVIAELLRRSGIASRWFVEFGVESGFEGNCVFLADVLGWFGLFMESDAEKFALLERKYTGVERVRTVEATVRPDNVDALLSRHEVPREIDVLSIDVDGPDYWIWEAIESVEPTVVVIEYNAALDPTRQLVTPVDAVGAWDGTDYFGASLGALVALGERKGYRLAHTDLTGTDAFFVRADSPAAPPPDQALPLRPPNYLLGRGRHRRDPHDRPWWDLEAKELVQAELPGAPVEPEPPPPPPRWRRIGGRMRRLLS